MIEPFYGSAGEGKEWISYGVSSYGYDIRVADEFRIFTNVEFDDRGTRSISIRNRSWSSRADVVHHSAEFVLRWARSVEYFRIPPQRC